MIDQLTALQQQIVELETRAHEIAMGIASLVAEAGDRPAEPGVQTPPDLGVPSSPPPAPDLGPAPVSQATPPNLGEPPAAPAAPTPVAPTAPPDLSVPATAPMTPNPPTQVETTPEEAASDAVDVGVLKAKVIRLSTALQDSGATAYGLLTGLGAATLKELDPSQRELLNIALDQEIAKVEASNG